MSVHDSDLIQFSPAAESVMAVYGLAGSVSLLAGMLAFVHDAIHI